MEAYACGESSARGIKLKVSTYRHDRDQNNNIQVYACVYPIMHVRGKCMWIPTKNASFASKND